MNFDKYSNKGLSGLNNLGNTCFINSCMQVLSHTYELNIFLDKETYKRRLKNIHDSALIIEWDELRKILWNENCIVAPGRFIKTIHNIAKIKDRDIFAGYNQNDMSEFLIFLIDCFHNSLSREVNMNINGIPENDVDKLALLCFEKIKQMYSKDYSEMYSLFYGTHISKLTILVSNEILSMTPEPFFILNLPIPQNKKSPSLLDCFDLYTEGEILDGENRVLNINTSEKVAVKKNLVFWSLPTILVIDIKRFNASNMKNQILVNFPLNNLNLSKYVIGYDKENYVYDLYGVCNHSGSVLGGHYTAFVKNANNKWYHYNDTIVSEVSLETQIITPKAYCFFYRKRS